MRGMWFPLLICLLVWVGIYFLVASLIGEKRGQQYHPTWSARDVLEGILEGMGINYDRMLYDESCILGDR